MLSEHSKNIIDAYNKGYRINEHGDVLSPRNRWIKSELNTQGYFRFCIRSSVTKKRVTISVHRLAAYQWFGRNALNLEVRHLDGDPTNNNKDNLAIGTHSENMLDRIKEVRIAHAKKAAACLRKLSDNDIRQFRKDRAAGMSYRKLMQKYGIAKSTVSYIVNGKTYS